MKKVTTPKFKGVCLLFKIVRFPSKLDNFFSSLKTEFRFGHFEYFRMLVLLIAAAWEDRNIASLYRYLDGKCFPHRTRYNNFMNVARWQPEKGKRSANPTFPSVPRCAMLHRKNQFCGGTIWTGPGNSCEETKTTGRTRWRSGVKAT